MATLYRGYECTRNMLTGKFYATPINDLTTCRKITTDTATELRAAIDLATDGRSINPWKLPRRSA